MDKTIVFESILNQHILKARMLKELQNAWLKLVIFNMVLNVFSLQMEETENGKDFTENLLPIIIPRFGPICRIITVLADMLASLAIIYPKYRTFLLPDLMWNLTILVIMLKNFMYFLILLLWEPINLLPHIPSLLIGVLLVPLYFQFIVHFMLVYKNLPNIDLS